VRQRSPKTVISASSTPHNFSRLKCLRERAETAHVDNADLFDQSARRVALDLDLGAE